VDRPPSTVDPVPSTVHPLQADLTAAVTAALQPVLARLEALETGLARPPPEDRPPSTVDPDTWELRQLKHSVRWTVYVPRAMKEALQRRAAALGRNPSLLVQEALARWLGEQQP
jgi:Ribbon-helix-helix protein, copG family